MADFSGFGSGFRALPAGAERGRRVRVEWPAGPGGEVEAVNPAAREAFRPGPRDHGRVVAAEFERRGVETVAGSGGDIR